MAPSTPLIALSALLGLVAAQKPVGQDNHPALTTYRCTRAAGCVEHKNYIVLDALAHYVHQVNSTAGCGTWGNPPPVEACTTQEECAENCLMEGVPDYSEVGVTTDGSSMTLRQKMPDGRFVSPRVYLLAENKTEYEMTYLTGQEFTFDVDVSKLPCGMNGALYLSEMEADGHRGPLNPGGATWGTGYCDAQCYTTPFINGLGNIEGYGACCGEMDIWEANRRSAHIAPHPCNITGVYLCEGEECGWSGVCDEWGCGWNSNKYNQSTYGEGPNFDINTALPLTVITRFPTNDAGKLRSIQRTYVQNDKVVKSEFVDLTKYPQFPKSVNAMDDEYCLATGGAERFLDLGAHESMGDSMSRGMVLAMSIWWDEGGNMTWLDSGESGPCKAGEGNPRNIEIVEPQPIVKFSNIRWGEIGSTYRRPGCALP